jgi:hypothetical protein
MKIKQMQAPSTVSNAQCPMQQQVMTVAVSASKRWHV